MILICGAILILHKLGLHHFLCLQTCIHQTLCYIELYTNNKRGFDMNNSNKSEWNILTVCVAISILVIVVSMLKHTELQDNKQHERYMQKLTNNIELSVRYVDIQRDRRSGVITQQEFIATKQEILLEAEAKGVTLK